MTSSDNNNLADELFGPRPWAPAIFTRTEPLSAPYMRTLSSSGVSVLATRARARRQPTTIPSTVKTPVTAKTTSTLKQLWDLVIPSVAIIAIFIFCLALDGAYDFLQRSNRRPATHTRHFDSRWIQFPPWSLKDGEERHLSERISATARSMKFLDEFHTATHQLLISVRFGIELLENMISNKEDDLRAGENLLEHDEAHILALEKAYERAVSHSKRLEDAIRTLGSRP